MPKFQSSRLNGVATIERTEMLNNGEQYSLKNIKFRSLTGFS